MALGIVLLRARSASVVGNEVARLGLALERPALRAGILMLASEDVRVSGNVVDEAGPAASLLGLAVGIGVLGPFESTSISDNSARYSGGQPPPPEGRWHALLVQSAAAASLLRFGDAKATVATSDGAVVLTGRTAFAAAARSEHAGVASNTLSGGGQRTTCIVGVTGDVVAQGNQCQHEGEELVGMLLQARSIIATGNRVRGRNKAMLVLDLGANEINFTALGNITAGGTHLGVPGGGLPAIWDPLNVIVP